MRKFKILLLATATLIISSCQKEPKASFTMSKSSCYSGEKVDFTSTSLDASSYKWTMPDGDVLTSKNISYTFNTTGTRTIKLEVFSKNEKKDDVITKTLEVKSQNYAYVGNYVGSSTTGCQILNASVSVVGNNAINLNLDGLEIEADVISLTNATIPAQYISETDECGDFTLTISGTITRNGNTLTLNLNSVFDYDDDDCDYSYSCTSNITK